MPLDTHDTATTRFVEAGVRFAYRRFGSGNRLPLLFCQHFTGTMDGWESGSPYSFSTASTT